MKFNQKFDEIQSKINERLMKFNQKLMKRLKFYLKLTASKKFNFKFIVKYIMIRLI